MIAHISISHLSYLDILTIAISMLIIYVIWCGIYQMYLKKKSKEGYFNGKLNSHKEVISYITDYDTIPFT